MVNILQPYSCKFLVYWKQWAVWAQYQHLTCIVLLNLLDLIKLSLQVTFSLEVRIAPTPPTLLLENTNRNSINGKSPFLLNITGQNNFELQVLENKTCVPSLVFVRNVSSNSY